ncbi:hypothetical protein OFN62_39160, partial [Escherichia coli]|nr:hypothetical protein [Escherichia coli]
SLPFDESLRVETTSKNTKKESAVWHSLFVLVVPSFGRVRGFDQTHLTGLKALIVRSSELTYHQQVLRS